MCFCYHDFVDKRIIITIVLSLCFLAFFVFISPDPEKTPIPKPPLIEVGDDMLPSFVTKSSTTSHDFSRTQVQDMPIQISKGGAVGGGHIMDQKDTAPQIIQPPSSTGPTSIAVSLSQSAPAEGSNPPIPPGYNPDYFIEGDYYKVDDGDRYLSFQREPCKNSAI